MKRIICLFCFVVTMTALHAAAQPAQPPLGPLVIKSGTVTTGGTYTTCSILTNEPVVLENVTFVGPGDIVTTASTSARPDLYIVNCTFSTNAPNHAVVLWRFSRFVFEHNTLNGTGGVVLMDNSCAQVHAYYNLFNDITGAIGPSDRNKLSAFQLDQIHCPDIDIGWNAVVNHRGKSASEDQISFAMSGGIPNHPALIHDNLIDGAYQYPANGSSYSGSGIMCYDPSTSSGLTIGGYTHCYNNTVIASENAGIDCAGSHNIEIDHNIVVNDNTDTTMTNVGIRTWNWAGKTPPSAFGPFSAHDNHACWMSKTKRLDYSFAFPQTTVSNNVSDAHTDAGERAAWWKRIADAGITIGAIPNSQPANSTINAMKYSDSSPGVKLVPLPPEHLGPPTSVGYLASGSWVRYNALDFGNGVSTFTASIGTLLPGGTFEVHIDSVDAAPIATYPIAATASWYTYASNTVPVTSSPTGIHDVFLVFKGSANVATFSFAAPTASPHVAMAKLARSAPSYSGGSAFSAALASIIALPLTDAEKAEAVRRILAEQPAKK